MIMLASWLGCLLIMLLITSIASQFISTLLVGNLGTGILLEDPRSEQVMYGIQGNDKASPVDG